MAPAEPDETSERVSDAPFPLGSVQAVASRAWDLCLREDPVGLLAIPFLIQFPVYVFLTILGELIRHPDELPRDAMLIASVFGVLPLVILARVFGESWILWRADAEAHGRRVSYGETVKHAFTRCWHLAVIMIAVYALFQVAFWLFMIPGILPGLLAALVVGVISSFANQAAVLGPGGLFASLGQSRDLVEHNVAAWCGMVAYWVVAFLGLGIIVTILRLTAERLAGGPLVFMLDLVLGLPLEITLLVFTACWTLLYRELEARRRLQHAARASVPPPTGPDISARAS